MYIPASFRETNLPKLHAFIEQHSFATLVSQQAGQPLASHLPLLLDREAGPQGRLVGHMARANGQWESAEGQRVLAIFHGPHAYISPSWYEAQNVVPTWNYVAVHAYGTLRLIEDAPRLLELLRRTVDLYEAMQPRPWPLQSPEPQFVEGLLGGIVGFEFEIERLEGKWKLSQNHSVERQQKVIAALKASGRADEMQMAGLMEETSLVRFE